MINIAGNLPVQEEKNETATNVTPAAQALKGELTPEEFVLKVVENHRNKNKAWIADGKPDMADSNGKAVASNGKYAKFKGLHVVYSGFNEAFKQTYKVDSRETTDRLQNEGKIDIKASRGGASL